ncbi:MAG TPA: hypothetical protein VFA76_07590 [Terriglobales bacterium]|nr:hypothetical protein [Terriglobales bacterium]
MKRISFLLGLMIFALLTAGVIFTLNSSQVKKQRTTASISPVSNRTLTVGTAEIAKSTAAHHKKPVVRSVKPTGKQLPVNEEGMPIALSRHLEKLKEAIPGNGGESRGGPGSAAEAAFLQRAYPEHDIPVSRITTARRAFSGHKDKGFNRVRRRTRGWANVGPSNAVYQLTPFRIAYVPNEYSAGGRTTALAIANNCGAGGGDRSGENAGCRMWIAAAGGGIWRTDNALQSQPQWRYLSTPFEINAVGSIAIDPNDPSGNTIWVGTGEANACGSGCEAGVGLYKSTNGGNTWVGPLGKSAFNARGIGTIAVKPGDSNTIYAASTRALRGQSSVCCGGVVTLTPGAPKWGLYKSSDGGATWSFIHNGFSTTAPCTGDITEASNGTPCSPRGVRRVAIDPSDPNTVYASSYARGVWRSNDGGATWTQIKPSLNAAQTTTRPEISVTRLASGKTRMYVAEGNVGAPYSRLFRSDDVQSGAPVFADLTSPNPADPGYGSFNFCTGQCWYDDYVFTPHGHPDVVYLLGSYQYGEALGISNGRGVVLSTDAGVSFTDMTMDATDDVHPNGIHPDQHFIVVNPNNPFQFFESSDGGVIRSSGQFADVSGRCDSRGLAEPALSRCKQLLSRVPTVLQGVNKGLTTLQFQSLTVNPFDVSDLQGGTQDNGTWESYGNTVKWLQTIHGDGGQSGFDVSNRHFRFHTFYAAQPDVNFSDGLIADWNWIGDPLLYEAQEFYIPIISDPKVSRTMFAGTSHVWRTKTHGMGSMTLSEFRAHCNEWTGDFTVTCGDWQPLGDPGPAGQLNSPTYGDRVGGDVASVRRSASDSSTMWAATSTGRVFISKNAAAEPAASVTFTRLDSLAPNSPGRFISGIYIDSANANHAWISYSGYSAATPTTPGHVFEVTYNPIAGTATWTNRSYDLNDIPITDVARDDQSGDLYAASDFGVFRLESGESSWGLAAPGMPNVEVAGLTIVPKARKLFAASHGLGAWVLNLP